MRLETGLNTITQLRQAGLDDASILALSKAGKLALHRHDYPAGIAESDAHKYIWAGRDRDGRKIVYVGGSLRA